MIGPHRLKWAQGQSSATLIRAIRSEAQNWSTGELHAVLLNVATRLDATLNEPAGWESGPNPLDGIDAANATGEANRSEVCP